MIVVVVGVGLGASRPSFVRRLALKLKHRHAWCLPKSEAFESNAGELWNVLEHGADVLRPITADEAELVDTDVAAIMDAIVQNAAPFGRERLWVARTQADVRGKPYVVQEIVPYLVETAANGGGLLRPEDTVLAPVRVFVQRREIDNPLEEMFRQTVEMIGPIQGRDGGVAAGASTLGACYWTRHDCATRCVAPARAVM